MEWSHMKERPASAFNCGHSLEQLLPIPTGNQAPSNLIWYISYFLRPWLPYCSCTSITIFIYCHLVLNSKPLLWCQACLPQNSERPFSFSEDRLLNARPQPASIVLLRTDHGSGCQTEEWTWSNYISKSNIC